MATSTSPQRKEQVKPVTGSVHWLRPLVLGKTLGRIAITNANHETTEYDLGAFTDKNGAIQGFGLAKDDDEVYAIDTTAGFGWVCDCADCQFKTENASTSKPFALLSLMPESPFLLRNDSNQRKRKAAALSAAARSRPAAATASNTTASNPRQPRESESPYSRHRSRTSMPGAGTALIFEYHSIMLSMASLAR